MLPVRSLEYKSLHNIDREKSSQKSINTTDHNKQRSKPTNQLTNFQLNNPFIQQVNKCISKVSRKAVYNTTTTYRTIMLLKLPNEFGVLPVSSLELKYLHNIDREKSSQKSINTTNHNKQRSKPTTNEPTFS